MVNPLETIILTLAYHHVFNFPLTEFEVYKYSPHELNTHEILPQNDVAICKKGTLLGLSTWDDHKITSIRDLSWERISYAQRLFSLVSHKLPTIEFVGVTGSTAALNARKDSDIDIFIITKNNAGWITRLVLLLLLTIIGKRTNTNKNNNASTFCTNMIIESSDLLFKNQDLFTAMELAHMKPIINNNYYYEKLLYGNAWVSKFLPNFWKLKTQEWSNPNKSIDNFSKTPLHLSTLNKFAGYIQRFKYRLKNKTNLTLSQTWVIDHRAVILKSYKKILNELNIKDTRLR
ncbi:nucleotidyltransferase domain-containing protein [bacterium]|uniref:Polymerase beta nucleotidyltransferase domain-containing protein n=2 Tax=Katanobacteria TaxID=422282 RepID=A0A2M7X5I4_UNCKA|nr:nucleotidyltransferase domain-containing protein [bacterium]PIP56531.1 MAG: hypothetical protein COX05_02570 [candidate division WWE3 bacterium CG22_combo_CG10-13_8_21_14_all_39_12]PJA41408.1 MAG: hypothetical protein CO179_00050 [candidate division WWE3 bacterium CG_4_9_14_3_um_filter_39_7]